MKKMLLLLLLMSTGFLYSQTLVETVNIPSGAIWNSAYGLVYANGKYWVTSGTSAAAKKIYGLNSSGALVDEITIDYYTMRESQGLAFDGTNFWYVERKTARGDLFKVSPTGVVIDSILPALINGGTSWYLGGAAWDVDALWITVYSPDAMAGAVKIDVNTKTLLDTIKMPAGQLQPQGITIKGDTLFIVNDGFQGTDKIYAYNKNTKELIYSFNPPERPGQRQNPRGLAWDGSHFWLLAEPVAATAGRQLFKYDLAGDGTPGMYVINPVLNFGNVQIDSSYTLVASINNYGSADLIIDSAVVSNTVYQVLSTMPMIIIPGDTRELLVKFTPQTNITYNDSVKLFHNFKALPPSKITVSGKGVFTSSYISLSPAAINYGEKRINSTSYLEVVIRNLGSALLTVDSITVNTRRFYTEHFSGPVVIDTASPKTFRVWFNPVDFATYNDILTIYSDAGNGSVKTVNIQGTGAAFNPDLGNIIWQGIVPPNPKISYNDFSVKVIKKIQDINRDGIEDIIATTDNYLVIAYNGNSSGSADIIWMFNTYINNNNAGNVENVQNLQFADVNNDGTDDVIVGTQGGNESVYALNGRTGEIIWEYGLPTSYDGDIMGVDAKRDWTGDGIPDVLISASGNESTGDGRYSVYLLNGATGEEIWRIDQSAQKKLKYDVTSTSIGGAFGTRVGTVNEVVGFNRSGVISWSFPTIGTPYRLGEIQNIGGDSNTDVIVGTTNGNVYALSSDAGVQIWHRNIGNVFIEDFRVVQDMNGNGVQDILVSGITPSVHLLEGATGEIIWSQFVSGNILGMGELPDMTGDALPEMGVSDLGNLVTIMNGTNGASIFTFSFGTGSSFAAEMVSAMGDVDGVGAGEFIAGSRDGKIIAFSGGRDGVVPVEMTLFTASVNGNEVTLNWSTATELNNSGFSVERRSENGTYESIVFIEGKGTTSEPSSYSYIDAGLPYGTYFYRLLQIDYDGTSTYSKEVEAEVGLPMSYSLEQNYPNPFNPATTIKYAVPFEGRVQIKIYNSIGEEIAVLVNKIHTPGTYQAEWNGRNNQNISVPSGVYIYRIETDRFSNSKKMLLLK
jgi:outer membrane protein assembly factor BamB